MISKNSVKNNLTLLFSTFKMIMSMRCIKIRIVETEGYSYVNFIKPNVELFQIYFHGSIVEGKKYI